MNTKTEKGASGNNLIYYGSNNYKIKSHPLNITKAMHHDQKDPLPHSNKAVHLETFAFDN